MSRGWGIALSAVLLVAALGAAGMAVVEALSVGLCENPTPADACEAAQGREDNWTRLAGGLLVACVVSVVATLVSSGE